MRLNPELQRNLWLELSPHRLVVLPAILAGLFFLVHLSAGGWSVGTIALVVYFLLTLLWGSRLASESVLSEIRDKTWDFQRMSSIRPWTMAWGKLLGSTAFVWYGAAMALVVFAVARPDGLTGNLALELVFVVSGGLLCQGIGLLASLQALRKMALEHRSASAMFMVLGLVVAGVVLSAGLSADRTPVPWYGESRPALAFWLGSSLFFLAWTIAGVYRLMRAELQVRNTPLYWVGFAVTLAVYVAGFVPSQHLTADQTDAARLFLAYNLMLILTYLMAFVEPKDPVTIRRLFYHARRRHWRDVATEVPCWFTTLVLVGLAMLALLVRDYPVFSYVVSRVDLNAFLVAGFLFLLRDVGIILYFNLRPRPRRADAAALVYLVVLHLLLPALLDAGGMDTLVAALRPLGSEYPVVTMVSGAVQAVIVAWLVRGRWRGLYAR